MPAHEGLHELMEKLPGTTIDLHRALVSMIEELEAVDWYQQRADAAGDPPLAAILEHNRDEEIEHFAMMLEYVRRRVPKFDEVLRTYLFTTGDITALEHVATGGADGGAGAIAAGSNDALTVGGLIGRTIV